MFLRQKDLGAVSLAGGEISLMKYEALAILRAGVHSGEYYEATNENGELVGYTIWMPPGKEIFSTSVFFDDLNRCDTKQLIYESREEQKNLGYYDFMSKLSDEAQEYFNSKVFTLI